jgi:hypothetical protein
MKRNLLVLFSLLLLAGAVSAQHSNFGVKGGLNVYRLADAHQANYKPMVGFHVGFLSHIHLASQFAIQPEVVFSTQGSDFDNTELRLNYINVPILFQYMFDMGFRIEAGPQLGFLVSAKTEENGTKIDVRDNFKPFDVGVAFGGSYVHVPSGFGLDARFNVGLSSIDDRPVHVNTWNQGFQLGVFYLLGHKS